MQIYKNGEQAECDAFVKEFGELMIKYGVRDIRYNWDGDSGYDFDSYLDEWWGKHKWTVTLAELSRYSYSTEDAVRDASK